MAKLDPKALGKQAGSMLKDSLLKVWGETEEARADLEIRVERYEKALSGTVDALQQATSEDAARRLRDDLERFLPSWKAGLVSEVASRSGSAAQAAAEAALDVAVKVGLLVARSFFPIPG